MGARPGDTTGPPEERARLRNDESRAIIKQWALSVRSLPGSGLRNAIEYMGGMWENGLLRSSTIRMCPSTTTERSVACAALS